MIARTVCVIERAYISEWWHVRSLEGSGEECEGKQMWLLGAEQPRLLDNFEIVGFFLLLFLKAEQHFHEVQTFLRQKQEYLRSTRELKGVHWSGTKVCRGLAGEHLYPVGLTSTEISNKTVLEIKRKQS